MPGPPFPTSSANSRNPRSFWFLDTVGHNILATTGWQFVRALQTKLGVRADGAWGPDTNRALVAALVEANADDSVINGVMAQSTASRINQLGLQGAAWYTYLRDVGVPLSGVQIPAGTTPPPWRSSPPAPTRAEALQVWPAEQGAPPPPNVPASTTGGSSGSSGGSGGNPLAPTQVSPMTPTLPSSSSTSSFSLQTILNAQVAGVPVVPVVVGVGGAIGAFFVIRTVTKPKSGAAGAKRPAAPRAMKSKGRAKGSRSRARRAA